MGDWSTLVAVTVKILQLLSVPVVILFDFFGFFLRPREEEASVVMQICKFSMIICANGIPSIVVLSECVGTVPACDDGGYYFGSN